MDTPQVTEKSCNTCAKHVQGASLDDAPTHCWDCSANNSLPLWEPLAHGAIRRITAGGLPLIFKHEPFLPIKKKVASDGSTASYYELPKGSVELQDLIAHRNMNAQLGEIFRECYRYGQASHCDEVRGIKKILFYANAELKRLEKLNEA